jgi:hypothetical protein
MSPVLDQSQAQEVVDAVAAAHAALGEKGDLAGS